MNLNFEELKIKNVLTLSEQIDFSKKECRDALLEKVNYANVKVEAYLVDEHEVQLVINVAYNINYLDALNLNALNLDFNFEEKVLFTNDQKSANENDIDYFNSEINLTELVWELILVDVPFNYSQARGEKESTTHSLLDNDMYSPFSDLFKN